MYKYSTRVICCKSSNNYERWHQTMCEIHNAERIVRHTYNLASRVLKSSHGVVPSLPGMTNECVHKSIILAVYTEYGSQDKLEENSLPTCQNVKRITLMCSSPIWSTEIFLLEKKNKTKKQGLLQSLCISFHAIWFQKIYK